MTTSRLPPLVDICTYPKCDCWCAKWHCDLIPQTGKPYSCPVMLKQADERRKERRKQE